MSEGSYQKQYPERFDYPRSFSLYAGFGMNLAKIFGFIKEEFSGKSLLYKINIFALKTYFLFFLILLMTTIYIISLLENKNYFTKIFVGLLFYFFFGHFLVRGFTAGFYPQVYNLVIIFGFIYFLRFFDDKRKTLLAFSWPLFESYPYTFPGIFLALLVYFYKFFPKKVLLGLFIILIIFFFNFAFPYLDKQNPLKLFNISGGIERFFLIDTFLFLTAFFILIYEIIASIFSRSRKKAFLELAIFANYFLFFGLAFFLYFTGKAVYYSYYKTLNTFSLIVIFFLFYLICRNWEKSKVFYLIVFFSMIVFFYPPHRFDEIFNGRYSLLSKENLNGIVILLDDKSQYQKGDYLLGFFSHTEGIISNVILSRKFLVDYDYIYQAEGYKINPEAYLKVLEDKIKKHKKVIIYDPLVYFRYNCQIDKIRQIIKKAPESKVVFYPQIASEDDPVCLR
ncbi:MAG: hypothetical protein NZL96_02710 [Patescibacteria group bacterium]|nr:hypothetical protein [Patescibacteria group bacterium]